MESEETQQAPEETQDTSAQGGPESGTPADQETPDVNWEKRFKDLQPELTKAQQEAARLRAVDEGLRDPERLAEILEQYGYDLGDSGQEDEESAEVLHDPRVDAILQERQQERETAILNDVQGHIDTLLQDSGVEVPQRFKQAILAEAWLRGNGSQIQPETTQEVVKEWVDEYKALEKTAGDRYRASKRAPHVSKGGTGATETPYRDDMSLRELTQAAQEQARLASQE